MTIPSVLRGQLLGSSKQGWGRNTKCLQKFISQRNVDYFREYILVFIIQFWKKKQFSMQFKINPHAYTAASKFLSNFSPSLPFPFVPIPPCPSLHLPPLSCLPSSSLSLPWQRIPHLRAQYCWGGVSRLSGSIGNCGREELFFPKTY